MEDYWKKVGEEIKERKRFNAYERATRLNNKASSVRNEDLKTKPKQKWPKGLSNIFNILIKNHVRFVKERIIGFDKAFKQIDFSIPKLKIFIEIAGPEHIEWKDAFRERQIKLKDPHKQYSFFRIKSDVASDYDLVSAALKPIINEWNNTL